MSGILLIDNYDSFTFNLAQYFGELGQTVEVHRNDRISVSEALAMEPDAIVVSPGPCTPSEAGISVELIRAASDSGIPVLGVCLGHQAIAEAFGGDVVRASRVMHGKRSAIKHDGTGLFKGLPSPLQVMRYHSLVVHPGTLPAELEITATAVDDPGEVHALRHREFPVWGVQFHPESILTESGHEMLSNFLAMARDARGSRAGASAS